ncbi:MAG: type I-E CRISPR-associated protein Cse2/CasB [Propionibacteriaceae bacterium]|jgi:CRISPR system Cascade subunit CasB|nr:type I-E CRISPR-associated protein Cse2/CasB [Propionibacteriaceae bacterium]
MDDQGTPTQETTRSVYGATSPVARYVDGKISWLEKTIESSTTKATLAHLRRSLGHSPGEDPRVWSVTLDEVPYAHKPGSDDPVPEEWAIHTAMALFALHRQSQTETVHGRGIGFGQAVHNLEKAQAGPGDSGDQVSPVRRRFNQVVTATTFDEAVVHMRGLIAQMRSASAPIRLDYGRLADDLLAFQRPGGADQVRRRWGRQYHWLDRSPAQSPTVSEEK